MTMLLRVSNPFLKLFILDENKNDHDFEKSYKISKSQPCKYFDLEVYISPTLKFCNTLSNSSSKLCFCRIKCN
jgi:hypothetical protein